MSLLQTAFIAKSRVPNLPELQASVQKLGFNLSIDDFDKPFECSGFLPCRLNGQQSGFEVYFGSPVEELKLFPHLKEAVGDRDCAITFRWGSDMAECACVLIVSAALASDYGALVHYQDDDLTYSAAQLVGLSSEALQAVEVAPPTQRPPIPKSPAPLRKPWWKLW